MGRMCCFNAFDFFMGKNFVFGCDGNHFFLYICEEIVAKTENLSLLKFQEGGGEFAYYQAIVQL